MHLTFFFSTSVSVTWICCFNRTCMCREVHIQVSRSWIFFVSIFYFFPTFFSLSEAFYILGAPFRSLSYTWHVLFLPQVTSLYKKQTLSWKKKLCYTVMSGLKELACESLYTAYTKKAHSDSLGLGYMWCLWVHTTNTSTWCVEKIEMNGGNMGGKLKV